jgi:hypothetical protein
VSDRFVVEREPLYYHWVVVDTRTGERVREYGLRTNWIDGRDSKPYGPEAAAREMARRMNEDK